MYLDEDITACWGCQYFVHVRQWECIFILFILCHLPLFWCIRCYAFSSSIQHIKLFRCINVYLSQRSLYNAWVTSSKLRESIRAKRIELQLLKQNLKLTVEVGRVWLELPQAHVHLFDQILFGIVTHLFSRLWHIYIYIYIYILRLTRCAAVRLKKE